MVLYNYFLNYVIQNYKANQMVPKKFYFHLIVHSRLSAVFAEDKKWPILLDNWSRGNLANECQNTNNQIKDPTAPESVKNSFLKI